MLVKKSKNKRDKYSKVKSERTTINGIENWHILQWEHLITWLLRCKAKVDICLYSGVYIDCGLVVDGRDFIRNVSGIPSFCFVDSKIDMV